MFCSATAYCNASASAVYRYPLVALSGSTGLDLKYMVFFLTTRRAVPMVEFRFCLIEHDVDVALTRCIASISLSSVVICASPRWVPGRFTDERVCLVADKLLSELSSEIVV